MRGTMVDPMSSECKTLFYGYAGTRTLGRDFRGYKYRPGYLYFVTYILVTTIYAHNSQLRNQPQIGLKTPVHVRGKPQGTPAANVRRRTDVGLAALIQDVATSLDEARRRKPSSRSTQWRARRRWPSEGSATYHTSRCSRGRRRCRERRLPMKSYFRHQPNRGDGTT